ncbi:MAG TPA: EamA family transporter [Verrucomicrobiae bacterium]|jgi:drug/metabolite transporter (DMT)-like permease|nr:EamA family transporter [Verrucomicrobiae bacterium]
MTKLITVLLIGLVLEAVGVVFLSQGLHEIGEVKKISAGEIGRIIVRGAGNRNILLGILFEACFFGVLLYLLSQKDVSLVWPLTSLGFVITAVAARLVRHEEISALRWAGVVVIVIGAALVAWSDQTKNKSAGPAVPAASSITEK